MKKTSGESQSRKFAEAAVEAGADVDESAFDRALEKVSAAPPPHAIKDRKAKKTS